VIESLGSDDIVNGGDGNDRVNGGDGIDACDAETVEECELLPE
jgi:Ca2+-binding RTX toxin-like protein